MVVEATSRQQLISLVKRKIHKVYIKFAQDKCQRGNDELMRNMIVELEDFGISVQDMEEAKFYDTLVSFEEERAMEEYMKLLQKYNKLF